MSLIACLSLKSDFNDTVGTNHGTNTNTDLVGWGALFNTSTDVITLANESNFDFDVASAFTISMIFKLNSTGLQRYLFSKRVLSPANTGYFITINADNTILFRRLTTVTTHARITTTGKVTSGVVYHIVATCSGGAAASTMGLYLNSNQMTSTITADTLGATILNDSPLEIGNNLNTLNFDGIIGETRIYNHALTATEIKNLYSFYKGFM